MEEQHGIEPNETGLLAEVARLKRQVMFLTVGMIGISMLLVLAIACVSNFPPVEPINPMHP